MPFASVINLDSSDFLVILVIVLLLFGARNLPTLFRGLGDTLRQACDEFPRELSGDRHRPDDFDRPSVKLSDVLLNLLVLAALSVFLASLAGRYLR